ncbi:hypothetical protein ACOKGD_04205 [Microbacterium phosphatis]|uniref:hypothetical protein n=1 Tax=Microbacterium phosphatis TaxID=3140248 RepID=UPI0031404377
MRRVLPAVVLALAALALAACTPEAAPTEPAPTESPAPAAPTETPGATGPTATAAPSGLPADCAQAYSPAMQDRLLAAFAQLNPAEAAAVPSSKIVDLLDVIQGSPNLTCSWTPPGTTALISTAALIPEEHQEFVRSALTQNFPACDATGGPVDCERRGEQQQGSVEIERVVLRGDLMLSTYALNADPSLVSDAIADMIAFLP